MCNLSRSPVTLKPIHGLSNIHTQRSSSFLRHLNAANSTVILHKQECGTQQQQQQQHLLKTEVEKPSPLDTILFHSVNKEMGDKMKAVQILNQALSMSLSACSPTGWTSDDSDDESDDNVSDCYSDDDEEEDEECNWDD